MITTNELKKIGEEAAEAVKASLKDRIKDQVLQSVSWEFQSQLTKVVQEFVQNEIVPQVREQLLSSKEGIISAACDSAQTAATVLGQAMILQVQDKLKDSWKRNLILKAMFE